MAGRAVGEIIIFLIFGMLSGNILYCFLKLLLGMFKERLSNSAIYLLFKICIAAYILPMYIIIKYLNILLPEAYSYNMLSIGYAANAKQLNYSEAVREYCFGKCNNLTLSIFILWIIGFIIILGSRLYKLHRLKKLLAKRSTFVKYDETYKTNKKIKIYNCDIVQSPMVFGVISYKIYIPKSADSKDLNYIMAHELTHIKSKDSWAKLIIFILSAVQWFNPVIYFLRKDMDRCCELACDEKLSLRLTKSEKKYYAKMLLDYASVRAEGAYLGVNYLSGNAEYVKERVKGIMYQKRNNRLITGILIGVCAFFLCLTGKVTYAAAEQENVSRYEIKNNIEELNGDYIYFTFENYVSADKREEVGKQVVGYAAERFYGTRVPISNIIVNMLEQ